MDPLEAWLSSLKGEKVKMKPVKSWLLNFSELEGVKDPVRISIFSGETSIAFTITRRIGPDRQKLSESGWRSAPKGIITTTTYGKGDCFGGYDSWETDEVFIMNPDAAKELADKIYAVVQVEGE